MDLAAASAGPWLVLGVVLGVLLAGLLALAVAAVRRAKPTATASGARASDSAGTPEPDRTNGWLEDDLPGFLDQPPGMAPGTTPPASDPAEDPPLAAPEPPVAPPLRSFAAHAAPASSPAPAPGRLLRVLATAAVLLIGLAAALGVVASHESTTVAAADQPSDSAATTPTWPAPDLSALPEQPVPSDPGAGRLASSSVPIGDDGALARLAFEGLVLERRAVGVTVAYPSVSVTTAGVPDGPSLAHVVLPLWNCLTDTAPADPVAAGCRRLPTEYAELPSPALTVADDGDGLRIDGRFATYVRPGGTPPEWTGRVYPFTVHVAPAGDGASGTLHLGTDSADSVEDPLLSELRRDR